MEDPNFKARHDSELSEVGLARRALPLVEAFKGRLPLARELADINEHFGVEVAQTVFNLTLERLPAYGEFIRRVRSFDLRSFDAIQAGTKNYEITFVSTPLPIRGIEGESQIERWRTYARSLGFTTDVIATDPAASLRQNADAISTYLVSNPHPRRILVTYGRASAEFRVLLGQRLGFRGVRAGGAAEEDLGELSSIRAWINIAGTYNGASYARLMNTSRVEKIKRWLMKSADLWAQLDPRLPFWRTPPVFPEGLDVVNIIGMPFRSDMPQGLMVSQDQIARETGPNDGVVQVFEAIAHPGLILPIARMSHKAEDVKFEPVFKRLLALTASDLSARPALLVQDVSEDQRSDDRRI